MALMASAIVATATPSAADEASAKALFKSMSDYMVAQNAVSFSYDANLEIVTADLLKVGLASSGTLSMSRPDKIMMTRTGGLADVEMAFDGKTLAVLGKHLNIFTSTEAPGTIDDLIDTLRFEYGAEAPAADLLSANPYETMMSNVTSAMDLGSGAVLTYPLNHLEGYPIVFGYTSTGRYLAVVFEHLDENPLTLRPITAYDAPERRRRR